MSIAPEVYSCHRCGQEIGNWRNGVGAHYERSVTDRKSALGGRTSSRFSVADRVGSGVRCADRVSNSHVISPSNSDWNQTSIAFNLMKTLETSRQISRKSGFSGGFATRDLIRTHRHEACFSMRETAGEVLMVAQSSSQVCS